MGGPCLAHKPWPENRLRQVGTGSSVFPLIKRHGGADAFLHEQRLGGRWGLPNAPCCSAAMLHPGSCLPRAERRALLFMYKPPCFPVVPASWALLWFVLWFSLPSAGARENVLSAVPVLGHFWRCHGVPSCPGVSHRMAWHGLTFSPGKTFPKPPAKIFLPLCKTIIISAN